MEWSLIRICYKGYYLAIWHFCCRYLSKKMDFNRSRWSQWFAIFCIWTSLCLIEIQSKCSDLDQHLVIRHQKSFLVLINSYTDNLVRLRAYNQSSGQYWKLEPSSRLGLFNIVSPFDGDALDLGGTYDQQNDLFNATMTGLEDIISQQWFIESDGTIVNAGAINHVLSVYNGDYSEYNYVVVAARSGSDDAKFIIEHDTVL